MQPKTCYNNPTATNRTTENENQDYASRYFLRGVLRDPRMYARIFRLSHPLNCQL